MNAPCNTLISKVLVLDETGSGGEMLKAFCDETGLAPIRPQKHAVAGVMAILNSNVDLGGILLYEDFGGCGRGIALAREIHASRPELPIFLRRRAVASMAGFDADTAAMFRCAYTMDDLSVLRGSIEASVFSRVYPTDLVRNIGSMTRESLRTLFRHCDVEVETPYLVKDKIIYGEVFTMIAIESAWCRGYMMLQAAEEQALSLLDSAAADGARRSFRELNNVLGEATNLIWGGFKNKYVSPVGAPPAGQTQVPIVINHQRRYISFGSEDPQLCFKYVLKDRERPDAPGVPIYQRFVFNLNWAPESFAENPTVESFVESGELELF
ncbi:MAG: chemotaxis protein CheX [Rhodocyclaceae bacterium]|nr:chemotaxis protein CheX [Rhodocyclaceae bacterium]